MMVSFRDWDFYAIPVRIAVFYLPARKSFPVLTLPPDTRLPPDKGASIVCDPARPILPLYAEREPFTIASPAMISASFFI